MCKYVGKVYCIQTVRTPQTELISIEASIHHQMLECHNYMYDPSTPEHTVLSFAVLTVSGRGRGGGTANRSVDTGSPVITRRRYGPPYFNPPLSDIIDVDKKPHTPARPSARG